MQDTPTGELVPIMAAVRNFSFQFSHFSFSFKYVLFGKMLQFLTADMKKALKKYYYFAETRLLRTFHSVVLDVHTFQTKVDFVAIQLLKHFVLKQNFNRYLFAPDTAMGKVSFCLKKNEIKAVNFTFLTPLYAHFDRNPNISVRIITKIMVRSPTSARGSTCTLIQKGTGKCRGAFRLS